jgi:hypothetical protein
MNTNTFYGMAFDSLAATPRIWLIAWNFTAGSYALSTFVPSGNTFSGYYPIRNPNGSKIIAPGVGAGLVDIAFDSTTTNTPNGSIWAIEQGSGRVYQFPIPGTPGQINAAAWHPIPKTGTSVFYGIALDNSRPMTLPIAPASGGAFANPTASGTILGLDAMPGGGANTIVIRNLYRLNDTPLGNEEFSLGTVPTSAVAMGMCYSAEIVRRYNPCGICSTDASAGRVDIWSPITGGAFPQALANGSADVGTCNEGTEPITRYLIRSPAYNPTTVPNPGGAACKIYPDLAVALTLGPPPPGPPYVINLAGAPTADNRNLDYVQWSYMCGLGMPFNSAGPMELSDAGRLAWSNP